MTRDELYPVIQKLVNIPHLDLGLRFDAEEMRREYEVADREGYIIPYLTNNPHVRERTAASWHGGCLISRDGDPFSDLHEDPFERPTMPTIVGLTSPYIMSVIRALGIESCARARIMRVMPHSRLSWHSHALNPGSDDPSVQMRFDKIIVQVPIISPKLFRYSVMSAYDYHYFDFQNYLVNIHSANYPSGSAYLFNSAHYHNVFNDSDEPKVSLLLWLKLTNPTTFAIVKEAVDRYNGPIIHPPIPL